MRNAIYLCVVFSWLLVCELVGWLVAWLVGRLVSWLVGSLVNRLVVWLVCWVLGLLVCWLVGWLVGCLAGRLVVTSEKPRACPGKTIVISSKDVYSQELIFRG